jgi:hypothetical protein
MSRTLAAIVGGIAAAIVLAPRVQGVRQYSEMACPRCAWKPPAGPTTTVRNATELASAVARLSPGHTILLRTGQYRLTQTIDVRTPNVTIRSATGEPSSVTLRGNGMSGDSVGVALSISAPGVTIADLTISDVAFHAIQVRGERGASRFTLHNARLLDTGQQLLKGSVSDAPVYADDGLVACSDFSYTTSAPSDYTNGVDILGTKGWTIRDNRFARIRGPQSGGWVSGPTILAWKGAEDTLVERNVIVDSFRGIALGLGLVGDGAARNAASGYDHVRGIVRNNVVTNLHAWADEAIEANAAQDVLIEHNTVLVEGAVPWSISVRFPNATAAVRHNVTNRRILARDGGRTTLEGNVVRGRQGTAE